MHSAVALAARPPARSGPLRRQTALFCCDGRCDALDVMESRWISQGAVRGAYKCRAQGHRRPHAGRCRRCAAFSSASHTCPTCLRGYISQVAGRAFTRKIEMHSGLEKRWQIHEVGKPFAIVAETCICRRLRVSPQSPCRACLSYTPAEKCGCRLVCGQAPSTLKMQRELAHHCTHPVPDLHFNPHGWRPPSSATMHAAAVQQTCPPCHASRHPTQAPVDKGKHAVKLHVCGPPVLPQPSRPATPHPPFPQLQPTHLLNNVLLAAGAHEGAVPEPHLALAAAAAARAPGLEHWGLALAAAAAVRQRLQRDQFRWAEVMSQASRCTLYWGLPQLVIRQMAAD